MTEHGASLRAERERRGMSLRALAKQLEVSPAFLSQYERGHVESKPFTARLRKRGLLRESYGQRIAIAVSMIASGAAYRQAHQPLAREINDLEKDGGDKLRVAIDELVNDLTGRSS